MGCEWEVTTSSPKPSHSTVSLPMNGHAPVWYWSRTTTCQQETSSAVLTVTLSLTQENAADRHSFCGALLLTQKGRLTLPSANHSQGQLQTTKPETVFKQPRKTNDTSRVPLRFSEKVKWPLHEADHTFPFTAEVYVHIPFTHQNSFTFTLLVAPTNLHITVNTTSLQLNRHWFINYAIKESNRV